MAAGVVVVVLIAIGAMPGSDHHGRSATPRPKATSVVSSPTPDTIRRRARALARDGRYLDALAVLGGHDHALARRLRRKGARALLGRARRELAASHEARARGYARRARRLGAKTAAAIVIRTADQHASAERAAVRERRRLAAIARDARTCSTTEKAAVRGGAATPAGCTAYAARVAAARSPPSGSCDPSYAGACLDPNASDYDCEGGSGNGPKYTGTVRVVGDDHFGLDADGDGIGCDDG